MSSKNSPKPERKIKEQTIKTKRYPDGRVKVPMPDDLTETELAAIESFKARIIAACPEQGVDERYSKPVDYDYLRFLRARKWVEDDAFKMMMATLVWRTANKPDLITEEEIESENVKGKVYFSDYTYDGHLICWIRVRLHKTSDSDFTVLQKLCMYWMEQGFKHIRPDAPATCVLFDMNGFGLANMDYKYVKFIIDMFANHYPESLAICPIVNSPWVFNACWYIIKPWIDPVTASKIKFMSNKDLLEIIPKAALPVDLGGESTFDFAATYVPIAQRPKPEPEPEEAVEEAPKKKKKKKKTKVVEEDAEAEPSSKEIAVGAD